MKKYNLFLIGIGIIICGALIGCSSSQPIKPGISIPIDKSVSGKSCQVSDYRSTNVATFYFGIIQVQEFPLYPNGPSVNGSCCCNSDMCLCKTDGTQIKPNNE